MYNYKISVIIPIYNVEKYLEKSIESVINQTYENLQIILIDDGSTDGSGEICDNFANRDSRVEIYHRVNAGVSASRNFGMSKAIGEYLIFVDADDWLEPEYCEKLLRFAILNELDVVVCNHRDIGKNFEKEAKLIENEKIISNKEECIKDYINNQFYVYVVWGKLYKRDIIKNLIFKEMKIGEDTCFMIDIFNKIDKIGFMPYVGYNYLCREGAITKIEKFGDKDIDRIRISMYFLDYCRNYFPKYITKATEMLLYRTSRELFELYQKETISNCKYYSNKIKELLSSHKIKCRGISRKHKLMILCSMYSSICGKIYVKIINEL